MKKRGGIWIRVSTDFQTKGDSPEVHEKRGRMYAEVKDYDVIEVYHLEAISGKSVIEHPEAKRMLNDVRRGHIDALIFSKLARLARNTRELLDIAEIFRECDAGLISLDESIDTSTPSGRFFYTLLSAMATWEREEIADRVAASVPIRAEMGKSLGGQAPFGYGWNEDKQLIINEEEASIRRLMYDLFIEHKRRKTVAGLLNEKGYRTRKGSKFSDATVTRLLTDPIAKGMRITNYTTARKGKKEIKDQDDWVFTKSPAIITEEKWQKVQDIIEAQSKTRAKPKKRTHHLFTGITKCTCGGTMYVVTKTQKYTCPNCYLKIKVADLESIFKEQLHAFSLSDSSLNSILEQNVEKQDEHQHLLKTTESEITGLEKEIKSLLELHQSGQIPTASFSEFFDEPNTRLIKLKEQREELKVHIKETASQEETVSNVLEAMKSVYENWDNLDAQGKRTIVETTTESIIVEEDSLEITLKPLSQASFMPVSKGQHTDMGSWKRST
jgi:site-specific DNA recombinase